ncbi:MAG TPA: GNAT family N-acetyltransferase [Pirellulales bacterium]|jgi:GNAT superfamily N-acetyltransferase
MTVSFSMRGATEADADFLYDLNRQTMRDYVCQTWGDWDETFQTRLFAEKFVPAENQIIVLGDQPIGLLSVQRSPEHIFVRALEIAPAWQRGGVGTAIMVQLLAEAREHGMPLELQVLKVNADARRLYERLGFHQTGETATHVQMQAT